MLKSIKSSRIVTIGGSLICAAGIGYIMQMSDRAPANGADQTLVASAGALPASTAPEATETTTDELTVEDEDLAAQSPSENAAAAEDTVSGTMQDETVSSASAVKDLGVDDIVLTSAAPVPPVSAPQPAVLPSEPVTLAALEDDAPIATLPGEEVAPAFGCEVAMQANPNAAALVTLNLEASCLPNERFTIHHSGMMFTAVTDDDGLWTADIPALSANAMFIAAFSNGEGAIADAAVESLEYYDRYVVQWKGYSGLQIHALEYGAAYGEDGHVWAGAAQDMATAARGEGGFVLRVGAADVADALMAEVYTFPTQTALRDGNVEISLEAEVTPENCGRDIEAQALMKTAETGMDARDIVLAMPECTATGDFLVLKNLYEDLKIARN